LECRSSSVIWWGYHEIWQDSFMDSVTITITWTPVSAKDIIIIIIIIISVCSMFTMEAIQILTWAGYDLVVICARVPHSNLCHNVYFIKMMTVFWVVAPCSLVEVYRRFRGPC
jgi:hypothetical protein